MTLCAATRNEMKLKGSISFFAGELMKIYSKFVPLPLSNQVSSSTPTKKLLYRSAVFFPLSGFPPFIEPPFLTTFFPLFLSFIPLPPKLWSHFTLAVLLPNLLSESMAEGTVF